MITEMDNNSPFVSVILPARNAELYLADAINSILDQTYKNFELIILSSFDCNQATLDVINNFYDPKIINIECSREIDNLPKTLNFAMDMSKGSYIARMDADDIALPHRLERQVEYMEKHPDIGICGSWAETFGAKKNTIKHPLTSEEIKVNLLFQSSMVHPAVIMRKSEIEKTHLRYNNDYQRCEDFDIWARASEVMNLANVAEILILYRTHKAQGSRQFQDLQIGLRKKIRARQFSFLDLSFNDDDQTIHEKISSFRPDDNLEFLNKADIWLKKISEANIKSHTYNQKSLQKIFGEKWFAVCYINSKTMGVKAWKRFWKSPMSGWFDKNPRNIIRLGKFFLRSIV